MLSQTLLTNPLANPVAFSKDPSLILIEARNNFNLSRVFITLNCFTEIKSVYLHRNQVADDFD